MQFYFLTNEILKEKKKTGGGGNNGRINTLTGVAKAMTTVHSR
jgi:hypothetical protein